MANELFIKFCYMHEKIKSTLSDPCDQTSDIAQGSVVGPQCFILFINNLPAQVKNCIVKLYADYVKLIFRFNKNSRVNKLQEDLNTVVNWTKEWQLTIIILIKFIKHFGLNIPCHVYTCS